jgi:hypothetical protein
LLGFRETIFSALMLESQLVVEVSPEQLRLILLPPAGTTTVPDTDAAIFPEELGPPGLIANCPAVWYEPNISSETQHS